MDSVQAKLSPITVYKQLSETYKNYYGTAFRLNHEGMQKERDKLLSRDGVMSRMPLIEPIPVYPNVDSLRESCLNSGLEEDTWRCLAEMLFPDYLDAEGDVKLRKHQSDSLQVSLSSELPNNPIVTAGTGSGKTE